MTQLLYGQYARAATQVGSDGALTPQDLSQNIFLTVSDMDGTLVRSYDTLRVVNQARRDIPELFRNAIGKEASICEAVSDYFENCSIGGDHALCRIDKLFQQVGHKTLLHTPVLAVKRVISLIARDFEQQGILQTDAQRQRLAEGAQILCDDYKIHHSVAHTAFEGVQEWLSLCADRSVPNAIFTNTEATYAVAKLLDIDGEENGCIDMNKIRMVMAKQDDSTKFGVAWDGSKESYRALLGWMKKEGHQLSPEKEEKLEKIHAKTRVFSDNKPSPATLKRIIEHFRPEIEAKANLALYNTGHRGEPFKLGSGNVVMIGETPSDGGCTYDFEAMPEDNINSDGFYSRLANSDSPRIATFFWQEEGARQSPEILKVDAAIRGRAHMFSMDDYVNRFKLALGLGAADAKTLSDRVLSRGYRSLNRLVDTGGLDLGLNVVNEVKPVQDHHARHALSKARWRGLEFNA